MTAGFYNRRIRIIFEPESIDPRTGAPTKSSGERYDVFANYRPISDKERLSIGDMAILTARFRVRWSLKTKSISPKDVLEFEGARFEISGVKETKRKTEIEITAGRNLDGS